MAQIRSKYLTSLFRITSSTFTSNAVTTNAVRRTSNFASLVSIVGDSAVRYNTNPSPSVKKELRRQSVKSSLRAQPSAQNVGSFISVIDEDYGAESISNLIYSYASSLKNLSVEDAILKFKEMRGKMDLSLVAGSYEMLITFCCESQKVHLALDLADEMCEAGLTFSTETLNAMCNACEENCEYTLARKIYPMLRRYGLKPDCETYRSIISSNVRMKDFDNAYAILNELGEVNLRPSASMYNTIMGGHLRENHIVRARKVLQLMKEANVKPDAETFSYLIKHRTCAEEIDKYYEELKLAGVQPTKQVIMALINGYISSGQFEKAKEVVLDKGIPVKNMAKIKNVLVSALASHGQTADALDIYEDMRQTGCRIEPKAALSLIEHQQSEDKLEILLQMLEDITDPQQWVVGCSRTILYCIRTKNLRSAVDLLKKLADRFQDDMLVQESIFDEVFAQIADMKTPDLQLGVDLLKTIRVDLGLRPSRKCLDFLLSACVVGKDLQKAQWVWNEYETADLPHNIICSLRMYQVYLASGHFQEAADFLSTIPKDDIHVRLVIHACRVTYNIPKNDT